MQPHTVLNAPLPNSSGGSTPLIHGLNGDPEWLANEVLDWETGRLSCTCSSSMCCLNILVELAQIHTSNV